MFKKKLKLMLLYIPGVPVKSSDAFISGALTLPHQSPCILIGLVTHYERPHLV
jgi:hypothetical protein